jgi:hypothetical protein
MVFAAPSISGAAQFKSSSTPVMLFGEAVNGTLFGFTVDGQAFECGKTVFEKASLSTPANTVPGVTVQGNECVGFGFVGATLNMGNCTLEFQQPNASLEGKVALRCTGGSTVVLKSSVFGSECEVKVGEASNTSLSKYSASNNATGVTISIQATGVTETKTKDNGLCPLSGIGTTANGTFMSGPLFNGTGGINFSVS